MKWRNVMSKNIAILGGGIMGLISAYKLLQDGHNITVHDPKGFPAHNASWIAGGMLAPYSEIEHMDMAWVDAGLKSIRIWADMPESIGFRQEGSLLIAHQEDRYMLERFKNHLPTDMQRYETPQSFENKIPTKFSQSLYLKDEAHLIPENTMQFLCQILNGGVSFIEEAKEPGDIDADWIIDCRGLKTKDSDLRGVKGEIALVRNTEFHLDRPVRIMHPRYPLYIVPRPNNVFMIGATIIESDNNDDISLRSGMELLSALYSLHPSFGEAQILEFKAGIRPSYPDNLPRVTLDDHVICANGLFRHGYLLSPVMAEIIAAKINSETHQFEDLFDGSKKDNKVRNQRAA